MNLDKIDEFIIYVYDVLSRHKTLFILCIAFSCGFLALVGYLFIYLYTRVQAVVKEESHYIEKFKFFYLCKYVKA